MSHISKPAHRVRSIMLAAGLASATFTTGIASAEPVTVVSWGGSYGAAQDAALFNDASKNSGIAIIRESGASMSKTCLQVESGSVTWDLVVTGSGGSASAAEKGCLEKIDYSVVDVSDFIPGMYTDYCVGTDVFATVMAWNTDKYGQPGSAGAPKTWADFWDVKKFPGTRAYRANNVDGALEPALMADGVPAEKVYEVLSTKAGMKRAIDKIAEPERAQLVRNLAERQHVEQQLIELGVDPIEASERVKQMTGQQISSLQGQLAELPAGAGVSTTNLLLIVIVLILLL